MRKIKDFDTEKKIYIGKVLDHIHYKKLHARIYEEISSHMDDMYEDFSTNCDDEIEVTKKVLGEMGHPHYLGLELKKVNKAKLFWARVFKIACIFLTLPILYLALVLAINIGDEISNYYYSNTVEEAEEWLIENRTDGKPIKLLTEIEHEGVVHRIYVPENQDEYYTIYHIHSINIFGINIKNRFERSTSSFLSTDVYTCADLDTSYGFSDTLFIYFGEPEEKYRKIKYIPTENGLNEFWSDFIEIPQDATINDPKYFILDCPEGYRWNYYERFDENKNPIDNHDFIGSELRQEYNISTR